MNKIILLILFNFLIYYFCKTNIYLVISMFLFMLYYIIRLKYNIKHNIIEGQSKENCDDITEYRNNFVDLLNDDIVNDRQINNYTYLILDKLNMFLRKYISSDQIPDDQPCIGMFDSWSDCSVNCGIGSQYRKHYILQHSGENGIKCIYKNGQIDKKTCHMGLCGVNASCVEDNDCRTGYCNPFTKLCDYKEKCQKYALYFCDPDECDKLGKNYHIDSNGNCIDYSLRENKRNINPDLYDVKINGKTYDLFLGDISIKILKNDKIIFEYKYDDIKLIPNINNIIEFNLISTNENIKIRSDDAETIINMIDQKIKE